jgi:hypothetical protein
MPHDEDIETARSQIEAAERRDQRLITEASEVVGRIVATREENNWTRKARLVLRERFA